MTINIDITDGISQKKAATLVNECRYYCYRYNRQINPDISSEDWVIIFGNTEELEQRYQKELVDAKIKLN